MVPREKTRKKWKWRPQESDLSTHDQHRLQQLLDDMEAHMELDRILEARKVLDVMSNEGLLQSSSIPPKQRYKINHILEESNQIQELLHDLLTDEGWTRSKFSRNGIDVHARKVEGTPIFAVKTHTILQNCPPRDFVNLCTLFAEADLMPKWFPQNVLDSVDILAEPSKYHKVFRMVLKFPRFLPISDRDVVAEGAAYHVQDHNAFLIFSKSISSSPYCELPKPKRGTVRMHSRAVFFIQLLPGNRVGFSQIAHDDLKLKFVPAFVVNYISQGAFPFELTESLKQCLANFEGSPWEYRLRTRREYYSEIEDRVQEEVQVMLKKALLEEDLGSDIVKPEKEEIFPPDQKAIQKKRPAAATGTNAGMPMWKAILVVNVTVSCTKWSVEHGIRLPWYVYVGFLSFVVQWLTRSVFVYRYQPAA